MRTMLIAAGLVVVLMLALGVPIAVAVFMRLTSGAHGLRERLGRLFRLPDRTRPVSARHYYRQYWQTR